MRNFIKVTVIVMYGILFWTSIFLFVNAAILSLKVAGWS